jgi:phosphatidylglycerol:prolipoprotein diacylglycerol transferase
MHPILFSLPLPKTHVPALYFYLAVIVLGLLYAAVSYFVQKDRANAIGGVVVAGLGVVGKLTGFLEGIIADKDTPAGMIPVGPLPIYSYGVMLGLSLVVGWYLTLGLAKRDGLPTETMANNYVITAVAAIAGSRILYVLTNLNEFSSPIDIFALRRGGLVAYGGFLGGFLGSYFYLRQHKIPLLPWADVAVPSLASGLMITRIGCYLFGCDFGRPLCGAKGFPDCVSPEAAPAWLQKLGTFPRWAPGLLHEGNASEGAPAWTHHVKNNFVTQADAASLPVHPTQLYECLVGASLLALLLYARTKQKFRGQIFLLFTFAYGVARYLIEILRDDEERGSLPFSGGKHTIIALGLVIFAAGFAIGFSQLIANLKVRRVAQVLAFVPAVVFYLLLMPASWGDTLQYQWSTSQFVGITTGFAACVAFSVFYKAALAHPEAAMRIPLPPAEGEKAPTDDDKVADDEDDEDGDDEEKAAAPAKKPAAKKPAAEKEDAAKPKAKAAAKPIKKTAAKKPAPKPKAADDDEGEEDDKPADDETEKPAKAAAKKTADDDEDDKPASKDQDDKAG